MNRVWVISPFYYREPALWQKVWEANLRFGFISVGWRALKDVSSLNEQEIFDAHRKAWPSDKRQTAHQDAATLHRFWHEVAIGDTVVSRRGRKSIAAIGSVTSVPYYDPGKARDAFLPNQAYPNHIDVEWKPKPRDVHFDKQVFGMQALHSISKAHLATLLSKCGDCGIRYADEGSQDEFADGGAKEVLVNVYERDPKARAECLKHHGFRCSVCDILFAEFYGEIGIDYIHVHHVSLLSSKKRKLKINPQVDLAPVCPNCHAMLHTSKPPLSIAELRKIVGRNRSRK
jgi:hypothetical protein